MKEILRRPFEAAKRFMGKKAVSPKHSPSSQTVIPRDHHTVSRRHLSENALKVLRRLREGGFESYLVGGCIRDTLLGHHPKDFDVATNATPEQVRGLFRNSRLIGRRFKLAHVQFGREIIEVATFRAGHETSAAQNKAKTSDSGRILRDNVYGNIEQDALRRDFTINALYYTSEDFSIHDYADGLKDIKRKLVRLIGDPETRYKEDPVRMLRAVRFAAKLDFTIDKESADAIRPLAHLLRDIPAARMYDEILKLLQAGKGLRTFELMRQYDLFEPLFPDSEACFQEDPGQLELTQQALHNTDLRITQRKPVTPAFIFATLLWGPLQRSRAELIANGIPPVPAMQQAIQQVISKQVTHTAIPKRFSQVMREIWELQDRLPRRHGRRAAELREHPRFRAAYDFMLLRSASAEKDDKELAELCQWWTDYQEANDNQRQELEQGVAAPKRARRRRRKPLGQGKGPKSSES